MKRAGDWLQTYTGGKFWPLDPQSSEVDIRDIAHSLSLQCRYAGHCLAFYSVAEHSVHVSNYLCDFGKDVALWGLLHDAAEAYVVDVPRPLKGFLAGYAQAEKKVMDAICVKFGIGAEMPAVVKDADNRILADEKRQNMADLEWDYVPGPAIGVKLQLWQPEQAEAEFLRCFTMLGGSL